MCSFLLLFAPPQKPVQLTALHATTGALNQLLQVPEKKVRLKIILPSCSEGNLTYNRGYLISWGREATLYFEAELDLVSICVEGLLSTGISVVLLPAG